MSELTPVCDDFADGVGDVLLRATQRLNSDVTYIFPTHQPNETVLFRVDSRKVASSSRVFRDMLLCAKQAENDVIDLEEHPALVKTLLDFVFKPLETIDVWSTRLYSADALIDCWIMFEKYDMVYLQILFEQLIM